MFYIVIISFLFYFVEEPSALVILYTIIAQPQLLQTYTLFNRVLCYILIYYTEYCKMSRACDEVDRKKGRRRSNEDCVFFSSWKKFSGQMVQEKILNEHLRSSIQVHFSKYN